MSRPTEATEARARDIESALRDCSDAMRVALSTLRQAVDLAEGDYVHNADRVTELSYALSLVYRGVAQESHTWSSYADARRRSEAVKR